MPNPILRASCFAALLALIASAAQAAPITVPTDLNVGDQYRLAFMTSSTERDATSANIDDYNAFVTAAADAVPELLALGTTWTAIGSTPTVDARDNTDTNPSVAVGVPIYDLADLPIAPNNAGLWDGNIDNYLRTTEEGVVRPLYPFPHGYDYVFTGSNADGTATRYALGSAPDRFDPVNGRATYGITAYKNGQWIMRYELGSSQNQTYLHFHALSGVLTVIPEPGTATLMLMGLAVLGYRGHRQRQ